MDQSLIYLRRALVVAQNLHRVEDTETPKSWGSFQWPQRAVAETMHHLASCLLFKSQIEEALEYAVQANFWVKKCVEKVKLVITQK